MQQWVGSCFGETANVTDNFDSSMNLPYTMDSNYIFVPLHCFIFFSSLFHFFLDAENQQKLEKYK